MDNIIVAECNILWHMSKCGAIEEENEQKLIDCKTEEQFFNLNIFKNQQKTYDMMVKKLSGKNEANNAPKCNKCGSDRFYLDRQTRSADEERNFEIHCPGCNSIQKL